MGKFWYRLSRLITISIKLLLETNFEKVVFEVISLEYICGKFRSKELSRQNVRRYLLPRVARTALFVSKDQPMEAVFNRWVGKKRKASLPMHRNSLLPFWHQYSHLWYSSIYLIFLSIFLYTVGATTRLKIRIRVARSDMSCSGCSAVSCQSIRRPEWSIENGADLEFSAIANILK